MSSKKIFKINLERRLYTTKNHGTTWIMDQFVTLHTYFRNDEDFVSPR